MSKIPVRLLGYWNRDKKNPEITFDVRDNDTRELVIITLESLPQDNASPDKIKQTTQKVSRELRNLTNIKNRLK